MDMVKLKVKYEVYRRYEPGPIVVGIINAPTLRSALLALADEVSMYNDKEDILDQEEQNGRLFTDEELLDILLSVNGDGCDCISFIGDEISGKVYYQFGDNPVDDWEITVEE